MEDFIKHFVSVFTNHDIPAIRKGIFFMSLFFVLYMVNDTFNFSFNYRIDKHISQIRELSNIYPAKAQDTVQLKNDLDDIAFQIRERHPWVTQIRNLYENIIFYKLSENQSKIIYRVFSASFLFIIIAFIVPFFELVNTSIRSVYLGLFFSILFINAMLLLIPSFEKLWINHFINIVVSLFICYAFYRSGSK